MFGKKIFFIPMIAAVVSPAYAEQEPASVNSGAGATAGFQGVVLSGQASRAGESGISINISNSCFGTNLRHVSNPIAPTSDVVFYLTLNDKGTLRQYTVKYPARVVSMAGNESVMAIPGGDVSGGATASYAGNNVRINIPINFTTKVDEAGNISDDFDVKLQSVRFKQEFAPGQGARGEYMGYNGDLSGNVYTSNSKDGKNYSVSAFFPGENGFCGGYFSPLMVFFDDKRPQFSATVDFPLNPSGQTMWPEKGSPGAFIALDRDGNKKITKAEELFGNQGDKFANGFEVLKELDSNKDSVIDAKDADFAKLLLWSDNGDGVSAAKELVPLKSKVKSISLKYEAGTVNALGDRAEVRERSTFVFVEKGKEKQGVVLDMWFAPRVKQAQK
ncbi:EF-hand domain-containing protein [Bdellovibrio reynosensis]|uniref:EF-hand domain-containing protein n=1 Tax=Bdellovibrio reynosensis TaxID=2835041 RepID=A0ABY4C8Y3_9BACT|nr:EF-hand domain-containing protein [Bdellovibrio reynosensis]UOF01447.1 EF-hand domain-containing protein [Bdellovibrio reynosensis]